jgi:hypothetical protein
MSELGNLTGRILLSPEEMSTVKIRAGSLFCTPPSRIGADGAGFGKQRLVIVNNGLFFPYTFTACTQGSCVSHLPESGFRVQSQTIGFSRERI